MAELLKVLELLGINNRTVLNKLFSTVLLLARNASAIVGNDQAGRDQVRKGQASKDKASNNKAGKGETSSSEGGKTVMCRVRFVTMALLVL